MKSTWGIVITGAMEPCDDKGREYCDDSVHRALWWQATWGIVMKVVKEHCDERDHGAKWLQGPGSIVNT